MARRNGDDWWAAAMTGNDGSQETIDLSFLTPGKKYNADIYTDDDSAGTRTRVKVTSRKVNSGDRLLFDLKPRGGVAIKFSPAE